MFLLGQMIGGLLIIAILTRGALWLARRRGLAGGGIIAIHVACYALAVVLYGFGNANGGPWNPGLAPVIYLVPTAALLFLALRARNKSSAPAERRLNL